MVLFFTPIFSFSAILPSGYTELEYIESTGTQYIDLNFGFNKTDEVEAIFAIYNGDICDKYIVSPKIWNTDNNRFGLGQHCYLNTYTFAYGSRSTGQTPLTPYKKLDGDIHKWIYSDFIASIPELATSINVSRISFGSTSADLRLFYGYNAPTKGKVQYYKHIKNGLTIFEGIPARRNSDNEIGLYDKVSNTFFTNSGTGTFIAGPVVDTCTYTTMLGTSVCLSETKPAGSYLVARQNGNKYYINLSEEENPNNPKPITNESNNVLRIKIGNTIYNAHDDSVD